MASAFIISGVTWFAGSTAEGKRDRWKEIKVMDTSARSMVFRFSGAVTVGGGLELSFHLKGWGS